MRQSELVALLPRDKRDTDSAELLIALGFPAVEPILPELVEWMQDINWPVAQRLQPFLVGIGVPLLDQVRHVLGTDDDIWKLWVLDGVVSPSPELQAALRPELERIADRPTPGEREHEVDACAREMLAGR